MKSFSIMAFAAVMTFGCNKNGMEVVNADMAVDKAEPARQSSKAIQITEKEVAQGDIQDILLALTRVHFAYDQVTLNATSKKSLQEAADKLIANPEVSLFVDGHTDERGTTEYNMSLGDRRARAVVSYLKSCGVDAERLSTVSFGEESLLDTGRTPVAHARNRRVDFRLMSGNVQFELEESDLIDDDGTPVQTAKAAEIGKNKHPG